MDPEKLARTFVELADSLVEDFDPVDLLNVLVDRCVDVLGVSAAGLILEDGQGQRQLAVSTAESARLLDLYQLESDEGPGIECLRSGAPVRAGELAVDPHRGGWAGFNSAATSEGFASVLALPLRLRGRVIGALNLYDTGRGNLHDPEVWPVAQAMADVSTIAILQERTGKESALVTERLQRALADRVLIEQAKGVLATGLDLDLDDAFELLRRRSRKDRRRLVEVAKEVVNVRSDHVLAAYREHT